MKKGGREGGEERKGGEGREESKEIQVAEVKCFHLCAVANE